MPYGTLTIPREPTLPLPITIPSVRPIPLPELAPGTEPTPLFTLRPVLMLSEEYTDNFNYSATNRVDNFRTSLAPGGYLFINDPTIKASLGGNLPITYDSSLEEVRLFYAFDGQITWQATPRFRLTATDSLVKNDSPTYADSLGLQVERNTYVSNLFGLEGVYDLNTVTARAYYRLSTFFNDDASFGTTITNTVGASASARVYELNTLSLGYQFLTSDTSGDFSGTDTQGHEVTASAERKLSDVLSGGLSGGYSYYSSTTGGVPDDFQIGNVSLFAFYAIPNVLTLRVSAGLGQLQSELQEDRTIFTGSLDLLYSFGLAQLTLSGSRGFSPTFGYGQNFGVVETQGVSGSLAYAFTPKISGLVSAFYRENIGTGVGTAQAPFTDKNWGLGLTLSIELLRWLTLDLSCLHSDQTSTDPGRVYVVNTARLALIGRF